MFVLSTFWSFFRIFNLLGFFPCNEEYVEDSKVKQSRLTSVSGKHYIFKNIMHVTTLMGIIVLTNTIIFNGSEEKIDFSTLRQELKTSYLSGDVAELTNVFMILLGYITFICMVCFNWSSKKYLIQIQDHFKEIDFKQSRNLNKAKFILQPVVILSAAICQIFALALTITSAGKKDS